MLVKRSDMTATVVNDLIIVAGGCDSNQVCPVTTDVCYCTSITDKVHAYNPKKDTWTVLASLPTARYRHAAAAAGNLLFLFGGRDISDNIITAVDVYDATSNTWRTLPNAWNTSTSDGVAATINSTIYVIGGYDAIYTALGTVWTVDTTVSNPVVTTSSLPSLITPRGDACIATFENAIYVFGGYDVNFCAPLDTLEVINPTTITKPTWSAKAKLHKPRGDSACGFAHELFHAVGGEEKSSPSNCSQYSIPILDVESYDPDFNAWTDETPLPDVGFRYAYASFEDTFYVFGGQGGIKQNQYQVSDMVLSWNDPDLSSAHILSTLYHCIVAALLVLSVFMY